MQVIVYGNGEGGLTVVTPTPDALRFFSIDDIAVKDVPAGVEYWTIDSGGATLADKSKLGKARGKGGEFSAFLPSQLIAAQIKAGKA